MANGVSDLAEERQDVGAAGVALAPKQDLAPATMLDVIARAAADPRVDPAKLSALLDLKERIDNKEAEAEFYRDYALAAAKMPRVIKDGVIDLGKGKILFAKYESLDKAIRPIETEFGFSRLFATNPTPNGIEMTLILAHRGGHRITSTRFMPPDSGPGRNAMQAVGSASSYAKRYLTLDAWNIITVGQDDDGNKADPLTEEEFMAINDLWTELEPSDRWIKKFAEMFGTAKPNELQRCHYKEATIRLKEALERKRSL